MLGLTKKPVTAGYVNFSFRITAEQAAKVKKVLTYLGAENVQDSVYWEEVFPNFSHSVALRGARKRESLTQKEIATRIGIKQVHISQMKKEKRPLGKEMAKRLAKVLNVDYRVFL